MCGIIGYFNFEDAVSRSEKTLECINYRGRDTFGFANEHELKISQRIQYASKNVMGHCLHALNDFVPQPLLEKNVVFVANCEIYNWKDLDKDNKYYSRNDAQVLFRHVLRKGLTGLDDLDGVYAFAMWNKSEGKVILARDIIGEKPIWYYFNPVSGSFAFASEKKALKEVGLEEVYVRELNPRLVLEYDVNSKSLKDAERKFFDTKELNLSKEKFIEKTEQLLINSIKKRISKDNKLGLLFSGGIDSTFLALILKKLNVEFTCYIAVLDHPEFKESQDLIWAKNVAKELDLDLKIKTIKLDDVPKYLKKVLPIIEDNNVVKAGVALPFFLSAQEAKKDGVRILFSGLGSEEIFAGYERHKNSLKINEECLSGLRKMYERDLYRDDCITMFNTIELRLPFLDKELVEFSLRIPDKYKIIGDRNKIILREVAVHLGLKEEFAERKKKAAQYGSNFDKAIEKLAKKEKKNKSEYLKKFYDYGNVRVASLLSTGKDSCLATQIMLEQNYDVSCFITIDSENQDSYMYHGPNTHLAKLQSDASGIPVIIKSTLGEKEKELDDLKEAIKESIKKYRVEGIVTGALFSNYQRERIEKICDELGVKCFSPLWHIDQSKELELLLNKGFKFCMVKVAAEGLDKSWLGREINHKDIEKLELLNKKLGLNVAGEGGEYESLVLDAPFFKKQIKIVKSKIVSESKNQATLIVEKAVLSNK